MGMEDNMSEKQRQKKDGQDKNKKNQARREDQQQTSDARRDKDQPAGYGKGLPRNDVEESKR
ncbi:MAG: hypothetical protein V7641_882 [Blastocatellia bacterium]